MPITNKINQLVSFTLPADWHGEQMDYAEKFPLFELLVELTQEGQEALELYSDEVSNELASEMELWPDQYHASPKWRSKGNSASISIFTDLVCYTEDELKRTEEMLASCAPLETCMLTDAEKGYPLFQYWYWTGAKMPSRREEQSTASSTDPPLSKTQLAALEAHYEMKAAVQQLESVLKAACRTVEFKLRGARTSTLCGRAVVVAECLATHGRQTIKRTGMHLLLDRKRHNGGWLVEEVHLFLSSNADNAAYVQGDFDTFLESIRWSI